MMVCKNEYFYLVEENGKSEILSRDVMLDKYPYELIVFYEKRINIKPAEINMMVLWWTKSKSYVFDRRKIKIWSELNLFENNLFYFSFCYPKFFRRISSKELSYQKAFLSIFNIFKTFFLEKYFSYKYEW